MEFIVGHAVTITKLFHETNSRTAKAVGRFLDFNRARMTTWPLNVSDLCLIVPFSRGESYLWSWKR
jgi:hypothetical protein